MKKIVKAKSHIFFVLMAILITVLGGVFCYIYVEKYNHKDLQVNLSQMEQKGTQLVCSDFTLDITSRGGDSGAWIKDPIYDEEGNELHGQSVVTIYEVVISNTSNAILEDWTLELVMPEYLWLYLFPKLELTNCLNDKNTMQRLLNNL